jgi:hypothetical protein
MSAVLDDVSNEAAVSSQATRWDREQSTYFYASVVSVLSAAGSVTITEAELRAALVERLQEKYNIILDGKQFATRMLAAKRYAEEQTEQSAVFAGLHRRWEARRDAFLAEQTERRRIRAERASRRRGNSHAHPPVDSDEEFDMDEPQLHLNDYQQAKLAAHQVYEAVRGRFDAEKKQAREALAEAKREARIQQRRDARRSELLSTVFNSDEASEQNSSESSSSSTPTKKKFTAAAVTSIYTQYLAQQVQRSAEMERELREELRLKREAEKEDREATARYRESKLKMMEEYHAKKLALLEGKENVHPNRQ